MAATVILSPHFDDAVFDCWHLLTRQNALVMNVFSGVPPKGTHRFWDVVCGKIDSQAMVRERRRENETAIALSGTKQPQIYLDYLDAQYRKDSPAIDDMVEAILAKAPKGASFMAPLAASPFRRHSDHVLLRQAGLRLRELGHAVSFYPDIPYMKLPRDPESPKQQLTKRLAEKALGAKVTLKINRLDAEQRASKHDAWRAYKTQYTMTNLFSFGRLSAYEKCGYEVVVEIS